MWREALLAIPLLSAPRPDVRPARPPRVSPRAARPVPAAGIERATAIVPGESLTYRVAVAGVESARAALAVGKPGRSDSHPVVPLRGAVEPLPALRAFVPFRADMVSYVDRAAGTPRRTLSSRTVDHKDVRLETRYGPSSVEVKQDGGKPMKLRARPGAHDALSALWSLRSRAHPEGERLRFRILDGRVEHRVEIVAAAVESIDTPMGPRAARRFDGRWRIPGRRLRSFSLWLTTDDARIPVRLEGATRLGVARFDLIALTRPEPKPNAPRSARRK
jgi:hypothetical protein